MADRKISELSETTTVASGDVIVVVTGVGVGGATLTTHKLPMSGIVRDIVNVNELVTAGTGVHSVATTSTTAPNQVEINITGYAYADHTHTSSNITDFGSSVSGLIEQNIKFQSTDIAATGKTTVASTDLVIPLAANSKYLCELGTIIVNNENATVMSGLVEITGTTRVNNPTQMYGTWNTLDTNSSTQAVVTNTANTISKSGALHDSLDGSLQNSIITLVNSFVVETTNNEADTATFKFATDSSNNATSGVLKKGSWFKAEKVI